MICRSEGRVKEKLSLGRVSLNAEAQRKVRAFVVVERKAANVRTVFSELFNRLTDIER
jgi:hypothetical protein